MTRIAGLVALAAFAACRTEPVAAGGPAPAGSASATPRLAPLTASATPRLAPLTASATPRLAPFDAARFDPAAKAFVDAALAYAETCDLNAEAPEGWFDYITYDVCATDEKDLAAVLAAGKAFEDAAAPMQDWPPPAQALAAEVRIFRDWAEGVDKIKVSRGTMLIYQGLALAYNAYKPDAKVPTEPKRALDQYFVAYPSRGVAYIWEQPGCYDAKTFEYNGCDPTKPTVRLDRYAIHRQRGTPLAWRSSAQGPYLAD